MACNHKCNCESNIQKSNEVTVNLMNEQDFKLRVTAICNKIADIVGRSMGPFGRSTVIQTVDNIYTTKDGWNIMNQLNFKNPTDNAIAKMLINVAQSVVLKVGDGTTTAIVVADELNRLILKYISEHPEVTPRDLEKSLTASVDMITDNLAKSAEEINETNKSEIIRKIALVSTNWDTEISDLISDIYENTDNPIIKVQDSGTERSYVDIEDGYNLSAKLMAPEIFAIDGECRVDEPMILVYNHGIKESDFLALYSIAGTMNNNVMINKPKLVVLAPSFEEGFITRMKATFASCVKSGIHANMPIIPVKYMNALLIDRECASDLTALLGGVMITKSSTDYNNKFKELNELILNIAKHDPDVGENPQEVLSQKLAEMVDFIIEHHAGGCESIKINDKNILATGLTSANTEVVDKTKQFLINEIDKLNKDADAHTTLSEGIRLKKVRLGKLNCNMGTIFVGGYGDAYLKARRDAIDDATRACEAAYRNGYVCGNGIATINAALSVQTEISSNDITESEYSDKKYMFDMTNLVIRAFCKVYFTLIANSMGVSIDELFSRWCEGSQSDMYDDIMNALFTTITHSENSDHVIDKIHEIATTLSTSGIHTFVNFFNCVHESCAYDLINDEIDASHNIINPVDVDIEVLRVV